MTTTDTVTEPILSEAILAHCGERAATYDRENRFFMEDFEELKQAGYLRSPIPREFEGGGYSLVDLCREQRRLAYHAPATALALTMHLLWLGMAADLHHAGDSSLDWVLEEGARGEVFASGHSETGNDLSVLYSTNEARRVDGGYSISGRKHFGSLSPVWTRLGLSATDASDPANPKIVHGFLPREATGFRIAEVWDTLAMRATRSDDTILEGALIPDRYVVRILPAGFAGADLFVLSMFAWALPTWGAIYLGIADRASDLALATATKKTSIAFEGKTMAYNPMVQHQIAEMLITLQAAGATIDRVAQDWTAGVDHGQQWAAQFVGAKYIAVEAAQKVVDLAMDIVGGGVLFRGSELERLYRDVRAGKIHPANAALTHEIVGKTALGLLGQEPRWG